MKTVIIDYGSGNLHSAHKAFERAAADNSIKAEIVVSNRADDVMKADRIVLPGVGAFKDCHDGLMAVAGMREALQQKVIVGGFPFLGICVGMQLMATRGLEHETTQGLGWVAGDVVRITPRDANLKIPHMGWNTLDVQSSHPVLDGIETGAQGLHAYFVHSYHLQTTLPEEVVATRSIPAP
jgi:imidazole glycerol-phosphate synthase subunit HisH